MIEQFSFDIQLIFAILNGKVSAAINRKLSRNFRQNGVDITPEQWTVLLFLWERDGVTQQELCNATFKDKPSMTRLIDNMERQHLVVRISDKKDRRTNLVHLTKTGRELEELLCTVNLLRNKYHFQGYIHLKAIPGAAPELIARAGYLADRMSVNLELPTADGLRKLAPHKSRQTMF